MKKINLVQTGGTISMQAWLEPSARTDLLRSEIPELSGIADLHVDELFCEDSSDINIIHWQKLIDHVAGRSREYDGFVILHGTDTMAYTASALSFALMHPGKPVIFTGSQVPMGNLRSDARRNLVNAVELATCPVNEVSICFNDHLFRANRATKMSIGDFNAFSSPNHPPLAHIGLDIELTAPATGAAGLFSVRREFSDRLCLVKLYPNLDPDLLGPPQEAGLQAVILEAFGSGNFPVRGRYSLLPFIENCRESGIEIIVISQAPYDAVDLTLYESGRAALQLGAVSGGDMTVEATVTKTMHLLGKNLAGEEFKRQFEANCAGERTR